MNEFLKLLLPWWGPTNWISDGFIIAIALYAVLLGTRFLWKTSRRRRYVNGLGRAVRKFSRPAHPEILPRLSEEFNRNGEFAEAWQEFEDSLITRQRDQNQSVVYKTDEASLFFSEDRLLDQHLNLRFWNSVPALLVGLGILGTFVGLVWGLIPFSDIDFTHSKTKIAIKTEAEYITLHAAIERVKPGDQTHLTWERKKILVSDIKSKLSEIKDTIDKGEVWEGSISIDSVGQIQDAIKELLSGVSTAFVTSVWGMFTSLLFSKLEKWQIGRVSRTIANLQRALDQLFTLTTQEEISFRQEDELSQQTAALRSFSTDLADSIRIAMDKIMSQRLENLHDSLIQLHNQNEQGRTEIVQEFHNAPEAFSSAMAERLAPSFNNLNTAIEELRRQREESSTDAIQQLVEEFRESLTGSTTAQLEGLAETVRSASESLTALPKQLTSMMAGVQEQIDHSRQLLSATSEEQTGRLQGLMDGMLNAFQSAVDTNQSSLTEVTNQSIQTLQSTIAQLQESLTAIATQSATESEAMTIRMREFLELAASRADEQVAQRIAEMQGVSTQSIQALQTSIAELQQALTLTASQTAEDSAGMVTRMRELLETLANRTDEQLAQRTADVEGVFTQSVQTLKTAVAELRQSLTSTLNVQQQTIQNITSQTEVASVASIDRIRQLVEQSAERLEEIIQAGEQSISILLNQQSNQIQAVNDQIANSEATLARGRNIIEEMNASVTGVRQLIEATQTLSSRLMLGAERLENAGQQLTQASTVFNQENENYLTANRETIQQLQGTLAQSRELLNDFAQRFQTVDAALQNIFSEIQRGLEAYASTTRDTISESLNAFPAHLTNTANALAGSVEALREFFEELSDIIETFQRTRDME